MQVQELASPQPKRGEVKVKMHAARINPVDMDLMKGFPGLTYKKLQIGGIDGAGKIVELGEGVSGYEPGDAVYFYRLFTDMSTWAEEISIPAEHIAKIPQNLKLREAGTIALPLLTAYEALKSLEATKGETILIHGAGGGVGFQALQLAKAFDLKVIAHASGRDKAKLESVGADQFIDYKQADFSEILAENPPSYIFDVIGKETLSKSIKLRPKKVVSIAFPDTSQMHKTGVNLPGIMKFLMNMMNRKFVRAAKKYGVELLGQVTGVQGGHLAEAATILEKITYVPPKVEYLHIEEIKERGLGKADLGKVILFARKAVSKFIKV
ncbi:MAG: NADP-dependent oxidoreductase [Bacteroidota bacterium]